MKKEDLEKTLQHKNIKDVKWINPDRYNFSRTISFQVREIEYKIIWYKNFCTFLIDKLEIFFTDLEQSGTWPNRYKLNLQFSYGKNCIMVLPIEAHNDAF